jgi:hypothetical protein
MAQCTGPSCPYKSGANVAKKTTSKPISKSAAKKAPVKSAKSSSKTPAKKTDIFSRTGRAVKNLFTGTKEALVGKAAETKRFPTYTKGQEAVLDQLRSQGLNQLQNLPQQNINAILASIQQQQRPAAAPLQQYGQQLNQSNPLAPLNQFAQNMGQNPLAALQQQYNQSQQQPNANALQGLTRQTLQNLSGNSAYDKFNPIAEAETQRYLTQIVPAISERLGAGSKESSALKGALQGSAQDLSTQLAGLRAQYGLQQQGESRGLLDLLTGRQLQGQEQRQNLASRLSQFGLEERGQRQNLAGAQSAAQFQKLGLSADNARALSDMLNRQNALQADIGFQGANLGQNQRSQQSNQAFNQLQLGLQPKFSTGFNPSQPGLLQNILGGVGQAAGTYLPLKALGVL